MLIGKRLHKQRSKSVVYIEIPRCRKQPQLMAQNHSLLVNNLSVIKWDHLCHHCI